MADTKISALTAASALAAADIAPVVQGGANVKATVQQIVTAATGSTAFRGETLTTSKPAIDLAQTWNASGVTFTGIKFNATDTASAANSLLMDLQVGGASRFSVNKEGAVSTRGNIILTNPAGTGTTYISNDADAVRAGRAGLDYFWARQDVFLLNSESAVAWGVINAVSSDLIIRRDAANTLAQRNGVNAQTFRLYNTYTDASNYERGFMRWNSNVLEIGSEGAGTGANRIVSLNANGSSVFTYGLGVTPGAASSDANHCWLALRGGMGIAKLNLTMRVFTASQDHYTDIGGNNATYPQLRVTRDAIIFSRYTMSATDTFRIYIQDEGGQDKAHKHLQINAEDAATANTVNVAGGNLVLRGGVGASASSGEANGGNVTIRGGAGYGTGRNGLVIMDNLPTANPLVAGALWNNSGVLSISAG